MIDHKAIERERDERSQGNIELRYIKAVCVYIYIYRENKGLERDEMSQGSRER